ncbi:GNAT family N-acetyltransferase [Janibacter melonis]|uniref:GNAT family N-acetyltransferase n=1 Tax=Janibacter melonis TaxID=262209 RepID=UPI00204400E5|nr:GNAT family N-acetyltransferase [Janibacter melonis]MCM3553593.1 GNAT family N-acetyltransferase [Janibacter melonis]
MSDLRHVRTERLQLDVPTIDDLEPLHVVYADPRTWAHSPDHLHADERTTFVMLAGWLDGWERDGLGPWVVRSLDGGAFLGNAGRWLLAAGCWRGGWWNLGYAIAPDARRAGLATKAARPALAAARAVRPDTPLIARLLEHNSASKGVAERLGMTRVHRGPDEGNPDPAAIRLIYCDRDLTPEELTARLG